jgi:ribosomal protein L37AE/L43A
MWMMRSKSLWLRPKFSGVTVGGSGGGQPLPLVILTVVVLAMALITVFDSVTSSGREIDLSKQIPFKCTNPQCNEVKFYTLGELKTMQKPGSMGPMMGPMILDCPKCSQHTLTQAVKCPKCDEVFIMKMDPSKGMFDDKCPKCGVSYAKAWKEKYQKKNGK